MSEMQKGELVHELDTVWRSIGELCRDLSPEQWSAPTQCPGWTVQDQVAHMIGTESMLAGKARPEVKVDKPYLRNDIGRANEAWIETFRSHTGPDVLAAFAAITDERRAQLAAKTQEDFDAESWTPAGQATYGRFMQIRVFDCWVHEQDMREALGRPGHLAGPVVRRSLTEVETALGYIVGKKAGAPDGSAISFLISGPTEAVINVAVIGKAMLVAALDHEPDAIIRTDVATWFRLVCGRVDPAVPLADGRLKIEGLHRELGEAVVRNLGYTI